MENQTVKKRGRPKGIHTPIKYFSKEDKKSNN